MQNTEDGTGESLQLEGGSLLKMPEGVSSGEPHKADNQVISGTQCAKGRYCLHYWRGQSRLSSRPERRDPQESCCVHHFSLRSVTCFAITGAFPPLGLASTMTQILFLGELVVEHQFNLLSLHPGEEGVQETTSSLEKRVVGRREKKGFYTQLVRPK